MSWWATNTSAGLYRVEWWRPRAAGTTRRPSRRRSTGLMSLFFTDARRVDGVRRATGTHIAIDAGRETRTRRHAKKHSGSSAAGGAYASLRQKHGRHHHIAAKALTDDDRKRVQAYDESTKFQRPKIPEGARRRPWRAKRDEPERATDAAEFAQRAVDREEKRKRKRGDKEDSSSSSSDPLRTRATTTGRGATPSSRRTSCEVLGPRRRTPSCM